MLKPEHLGRGRTVHEPDHTSTTNECTLSVPRYFQKHLYLLLHYNELTKAIYTLFTDNGHGAEA